ncbi:MAG: heavy metal-binding domain-containing protein [Acidobacteriota bacterium]
MKTAAVIVAALMLIGSVMTGSTAAFAQSPSKEKTKTQKSKVIYQCPMHPEVTSDKPGTCPKCKMDLVKVEKKSAPSKQKEKKAPALQEKSAPSKQAPAQNSGVRAAQAGDTASVVYTCPMHPDVTSSQPGKCPRCKMDLVKKNTDH